MARGRVRGYRLQALHLHGDVVHKDDAHGQSCSLYILAKGGGESAQDIVCHVGLFAAQQWLSTGGQHITVRLLTLSAFSSVRRMCLLALMRPPCLASAFFTQASICNISEAKLDQIRPESGNQ